jgi:hypothetical protein
MAVIERLVKRALAAVLPPRRYQALAGRWRRRGVRWGTLRRAEPVSRAFGFDRGTPVDRRYIEAFLAERSSDIRGRVLEVGDAAYTRRFGGARVVRSDVLHRVAGNADATLVGDLATGDGVPSAAFDCIVLTQVLPFIYEVGAAVATCRRALAPGGVVLATLPGISQISRHDLERWGDFWRFTPLSARRLFAEAFGEAEVEVSARGNVTAAIALLHGLAAEELRASDLERDDSDYPVTICVRARAGKAP